MNKDDGAIRKATLSVSTLVVKLIYLKIHENGARAWDVGRQNQSRSKFQFVSSAESVFPSDYNL